MGSQKCTESTTVHPVKTFLWEKENECSNLCGKHAAEKSIGDFDELRIYIGREDPRLLANDRHLYLLKNFENYV